MDVIAFPVPSFLPFFAIVSERRGVFPGRVSELDFIGERGERKGGGDREEWEDDWRRIASPSDLGMP